MSKPDLRGVLTVFIIASDEPEYPQCLAALEAQDCSFELETIRNVAPMDVAFQRMLDNCKTRYYIQVDADMILYTDSIRKMHQDMAILGQDIAMLCFPLHDVHLGHLLTGVKIYRHEIMKRYPYVGSYSCEVDQLARMAKDGFQWESRWPDDGITFNSGFDKVNHPMVKGKHGAVWTEERMFERYKRLMQKWRKFGYGWLEFLPQKFLDRLIKEPTDINLWAFMGAVAGLTAPEGDDKERDFRDVDQASVRLSDLVKAPQISGSMVAGRPRVAMRDQETPTHSLSLPDAALAVVPPGPSELNVYMSAKCNLSCNFCRRQHGSADSQNHPYEVHGDFLREILDRFPTIQSACVAGFGEPLLAKTLPETLRVLSERKIATGLITNGTLLTTSSGKLEGADLQYISVSLNAATHKEYFRTTKQGLFRVALDGIRLLVSMGHKVGVSFVCTKRNVNLIQDYIALARSLGVDFVSLHNLLPHFSDSYSSEEFWSLVIKETDTLVLETLDRLKHQHAGFVTSWPVPISRQYCPRKCNSPYVSIGVDGMTHYSGCRRVSGPELGNGSVRDGDVWTSPYFQALRSGLDGSWPMRDLCAMCFGNWL